MCWILCQGHLVVRHTGCKLCIGSIHSPPPWSLHYFCHRERNYIHDAWPYVWCIVSVIVILASCRYLFCKNGVSACIRRGQSYLRRFAPWAAALTFHKTSAPFLHISGRHVVISYVWVVWKSHISPTLFLGLIIICILPSVKNSSFIFFHFLCIAQIFISYIFHFGLIFTKYM